MFNFDAKVKICVVGLGYVGLPLAVEFDKNGLEVIGYENNIAKLDLLNKFIDPTNEVGDEQIKKCKIKFTNDEAKIRDANFIIVTVPTPINNDHTPDLSFVVSATETIAKNMRKGAVIVYESTVYPGCTEDVCVPVLEQYSKLNYKIDFKVGYSPERINPGDSIHRVWNIKKIVSGCDKETCLFIKKVYDLIIKVGTFPVSNIRTAEAIKVVENSQRDINIAFMNELSMVFDRMDIDTNEVVDGMNTKWNALGFRPGLVGGHCIGIDPYYFTYQADILGYHSKIILNGRIVNDNMGKFVAESTIKQMIKSGLTPKKSKVAILGLTFKENCKDVRNSRVVDIISVLNDYDIETVVVDPVCDKNEAKRLYNIDVQDINSVKNVDCIIIAVKHEKFKELNFDVLNNMYIKKTDSINVLIDVKGLFKKNEFEDKELAYWRL